MKLVDSDETVVLVTGSSEGAYSHDRPLAEWLKQEIDRRGAGHTYRRAVIVADVSYLDSPKLEGSPTIAIGGPGVNRVAQSHGDLPMVFNQGDEAFIQAEFDGPFKRASCWGVNAAATKASVDAFVTAGFLDELIDRIWRFRSPVMV